MFADYLAKRMRQGEDLVDAMAEVVEAQIKTSLFFSIIKSLYPEETDLEIAEKSMKIVSDFRLRDIYPATMNEKITLVFREYVKQKGGYPDDSTKSAD